MTDKVLERFGVKNLIISPDNTRVTMSDDVVYQFTPALIQIEMENGDIVSIDQVVNAYPFE